MEKEQYIDEYEIEEITMVNGYTIQGYMMGQKMSYKVVAFGKVKRWKKKLFTNETFGHYTQIEPLVSPDEVQILFPAFEELDCLKEMKLMFNGEPLNTPIGELQTQ